MCCKMVRTFTSRRNFPYKLSEKNVAALDRADVYLDDECVAKDGDVLKKTGWIRDRLGYPWRGGENDAALVYWRNIIRKN